MSYSDSAMLCDKARCRLRSDLSRQAAWPKRPLLCHSPPPLVQNQLKLEIQISLQFNAAGHGRAPRAHLPRGMGLMLPGHTARLLVVPRGRSPANGRSLLRRHVAPWAYGIDSASSRLLRCQHNHCGTIRAAGAVWPSATSRVFADSLSTGVFISFVEHRLVIQGFFSQVGDSTPPFLCRRLGLTVPLLQVFLLRRFPIPATYHTPGSRCFGTTPPVRSRRESSRVPFPSLAPHRSGGSLHRELMLAGWVSG